jgi:hypothetical protein
MSEVIDEQPVAVPEPVQSPETGQVPETSTTVAEPAPAEVPLDDLLAEFSNNTTPAPEPMQPNELEQLLAELQQENEQQQLNEKMGVVAQENAALRQQIEDAKSEKDFADFSSKLQAELPDHVDPEYARTHLLNMAATDTSGSLLAAWRYRDLTMEQRRAADLELRQIERGLAFLQTHPHLADQQKIQWLTQRGYQLGLAINSVQILAKARRAVFANAGKVLKPYDPEATETHDVVAAAVRSAGGKADMKEPPLKLGNLSTNEYRRHVRDTYGFDPGV